MEESCLVRCDSLDTGSVCDREIIDRIHFDPDGSEPTSNLEPSPAELAQCEAEVGTLLSIIADLNKKMGSLKAPSDPGDLRLTAPSRPLVPDLLSHRLVRRSPERHLVSTATSKSLLTDRGGTGVMWTRLQDVLSSLEDSISCRRTWSAPITASDQDKHREHLRAAQESWLKSSQILEELEREFGISCQSVMFRDQSRRDHLNMDVEKPDSALRNTSLCQQDNLGRAPNPLSLMEEDKYKFMGLHRSWRSGSRSPSHRPPTAGSISSDLGSPPFPGSPLLHRRSIRGLTPLSPVGDVSPLGSVNSDSPCPSPSPISAEPETERLNRYVERLKARVERLTTALERRKSECEQLTHTLHRLEADCSGLQRALKYSEDCEEAYSQLLSLYEAKTQQNIPLPSDPAGVVGEEQHPDNPSSEDRDMRTEEMSTSFSTAGVTEDTEEPSPPGQRATELENREAALRRQIDRLKMERAAICLPKVSPGVENKVSPETGQPAGSKGGHVTKDNIRPVDAKKEKTSLFYELVSVREEMSDLRSLIRLKEKELRCLEWSLMAQKAQEAAGVFVPESLREELEDSRTEPQMFDVTDGESARTRPILKDLQAVLQREQALKKRLALVHDSINTVLPDRKDGGDQMARLAQAHSKALSSYRQIRRKYREQVWRLEQKVAAITDLQLHQGVALNTAVEPVEWRREETVL